MIGVTDTSYRNDFIDLYVKSEHFSFDFNTQKFSWVDWDHDRILAESAITYCFHPHLHEAFELIYIREGSMFVQTSSGESLASAGELLVFNPNDVHGAYVNAKCPSVKYDYAVIELEHFKLPYEGKLNDVIDGICLSKKAARSHIYGTEACEIGALISNIADNFKLQMSSDEAVLFITSDVYQILALLESGGYFSERNEAEIKYNQFVQKVISFIDENYAADITKEMLYEHFRYNQSYFCRLFRRHFGKSFYSYLNEYRIGKARRIYMNVADDELLPVSEIATRVGFTNYCYFSRLFKKYTGVTPREYISLYMRS